MNESERHGLIGSASRRGGRSRREAAVRWISRAGPALVAAGAFGHRTPPIAPRTARPAPRDRTIGIAADDRRPSRTPTSDSVENARARARQPLAARLLAQGGAHAAEEVFAAPAAQRAWPRAPTAGVPVSVDRQTELSTVPFEGRFPPPRAQCTVVEPCAVSDATPSAQRQFDDDRGDALRRPYGRRAGDDARASRRPVLVSEARAARSRRRAGSGAIPSSGPFQEGFLTSVKEIVERPGRTARASIVFYPRAARARAKRSRRRVSSSPIPRSRTTATTCSTSSRSSISGATMRRADADLDAEALAAGADRPARRPRRPDPRDPAAAGAPRARDRQQPAQRREQPERPSAAQARRSRQSSPTCARPRAAIETPKRVLICRSLANSRNIVNRAEMIEALKPLGFVAIQPEKLSFDEQALTFADADIIVSEFGAAMANVMFCRPGTKVVEIIAEGQHDPWSSHLSRCSSSTMSCCSSARRRRRWRRAAACEGLALRLFGRRAEAGRDGEEAARNGQTLVVGSSPISFTASVDFRRSQPSSAERSPRPRYVGPRQRTSFCLTMTLVPTCTRS